MILHGDALAMLKTLPDRTVQTCVTSPPYFGLRDYGVPGQIGLEQTPEQYVAKLVEVFRGVKRVLRDDGTLWLNLGDSYATNGSPAKWRGKTYPRKALHRTKLTGGTRNLEAQNRNGAPRPPNLKPKDLIGIPWRVAFALQADGWYLRSDIIWAKPNPMPESVTDRPTKSHEYIFLLSKSQGYYYDAEAIKDPSIWADDNRNGKGNIRYGGKRNGDNGTGQDSFVTITESRNSRSVWTITTKPYKGAHFATFPPEIPEKCIKAGSKVGDTVLDLFAGSGTTLEVAKRLGRDFIGIELNDKYIKEHIEPRLAMVDPLFGGTV